MTGAADTVRVFVSVGLSDEAREQLLDAVNRIRGEVPDGIQWADPSGMHLTLKFLGNIPSSRVALLGECVDQFSGVHSPFSLTLSGLGVFSNRRAPRVLWAGVDGNLEALAQLQLGAEDAITSLGYPPEERPFRPHVTLGRPRRTISDGERTRIGSVVSALEPPYPVSWEVESVDVMRSELHPSGARYTVLRSSPLSVV